MPPSPLPIQALSTSSLHPPPSPTTPPLRGEAFFRLSPERSPAPPSPLTGPPVPPVTEYAASLIKPLEISKEQTPLSKSKRGVVQDKGDKGSHNLPYSSNQMEKDLQEVRLTPRTDSDSNGYSYDEGTPDLHVVSGSTLITRSPLHNEKHTSIRIYRKRAEVCGAHGGVSKVVLRPHPVYPFLAFCGTSLYLAIHVNFWLTGSRIMLLSRSWALLPLAALCIGLAFVFSTRGSDAHKSFVYFHSTMPFVAEFLSLLTIIREYNKSPLYQEYFFVVLLVRLPIWVIVCGLSHKLRELLHDFSDAQLSRYMVERVFTRAVVMVMFIAFIVIFDSMRCFGAGPVVEGNEDFQEWKHCHGTR